MTLTEIGWRITSLVRNIIDIPRIRLGLYPGPKSYRSPLTINSAKPGFRVPSPEPGDWCAIGNTEEESTWLARLIKNARLITEHRFTYFNLNQHFLGDPIDWHADHSSGKRGKLRLSAFVNYRDFDTVGDCKQVWEPNRHHQLVTLARAWHATGDKNYADEIANQLESWLEQNPFGYGMNWRSPLELGVRLINWIWALDLIRDSEAISDELWSRIHHAAYLHCWDITRKYSRGSSANNHLIGEAAGVFVAASYFRFFPHSDKWMQQSREILESEIIAQSYDDGCTREQALGYQFFVMQFFTC